MSDSAESPLADATRKALIEALADERAAEAYYQAVIDRHGQVRPFINIIESERRHQARLLTLFEKYGVPVPPASVAAVQVGNDLSLECRKALQAEEENANLYDRWLEIIQEDDIREAFVDLQRASLENHLPAFRRCAERGDRSGTDSDGGCGGGRRRRHRGGR
jgi:hypothetical protein